MLKRIKSIILSVAAVVVSGCSEQHATRKPVIVYSDGEGSISLDDLTRQQSEQLFRENPPSKNPID